MIKINNKGCSRKVFLTKNYAIKVPYLFMTGCGWGRWWQFLVGIQTNIQEQHLYKYYGKSGILCPVVFSISGFVLIMKRAEILPREDFLKFDYEKFIKIDHDIILSSIENKEDSFGLIDGKIVAVDYG